MEAQRPLRVDVLRSTSELYALEPAWKRLWMLDPHSTPFQSPEWLLPWWGSFGQRDLRTLVIWRGAELVAVVPLYVYEEPHSGERKVLLVGAGTSDYLDGIFSPKCTAEDVSIALSRLRAESGWDGAHFSQLRPDSLLHQALKELEPKSAEAHEGESCWSLSSACRVNLPAKVRQDLRNSRKFAKEGGEFDIIAADQSNWSDLFDQLVQLHTKRWERVGQPGVLADPAVLAWHRTALPRLIQANLARLTALHVDGNIVAVLYSLLDADVRPVRTQYLYLIGHSAQHAHLRPGTLLMALAIEQAAAEGVRNIDLLRGEESYKRFWKAQRTATYGFTLQPYRLEQRSRESIAGTGFTHVPTPILTQALDAWVSAPCSPVRSEA